MTRSLFLLFGDIDFDLRVRRMMDIASALGEVALLDCSERQTPDDGRPYQSWRLHLRSGWGVGRRHLSFWRTAVRRARVYRPDIIFAEDFFAAFPGWLCARAVGAKLVYDAHELIVPEEGKKQSRRAAFWYRLERFVVSRADLVIAANPERAEVMKAHYGLAKRPAVMRNIPPYRAITAAEAEKALESYPALRRRGPDDRILLYQGDVSLARGLERFIKLLDHLPDNYRLVIAGSGPDLEKVQALGAVHAAAGRFATLGRVPGEVLPAVTKHADIGIVTYPFEGLNNIYCAPNKVYEYLMAGIPIISSNQPTIDAISRDYESVHLFDRKDDWEKLTFIIQSISKNNGNYVEFSNIIEEDRSILHRDLENIS